MSKIQKLVNHRGHKCFYTGLTCHVPKDLTDGSNPLRASREHLVAKALYKKNIKNNTVVACAEINSVVGQAPLLIKFCIKQLLQEYIATELVNQTDPLIILQLCKSKVQKLIRKFKVRSGYPWQWANYNGTRKEELYLEYLKLLTNEEKLLLKACVK